MYITCVCLLACTQITTTVYRLTSEKNFFLFLLSSSREDLWCDVVCVYVYLYVCVCMSVSACVRAPARQNGLWHTLNDDHSRRFPRNAVTGPTPREPTRRSRVVGVRKGDAARRIGNSGARASSGTNETTTMSVYSTDIIIITFRYTADARALLRERPRSYIILYYISYAISRVEFRRVRIIYYVCRYIMCVRVSYGCSNVRIRNTRGHSYDIIMAATSVYEWRRR